MSDREYHLNPGVIFQLSVEGDEDSVYEARNEATNETVLLDRVEYYICSQIDGGLNELVLKNKINAKFSLALSISDLQRYLEGLKAKKILVAGGGENYTTVETADHYVEPEEDSARSSRDSILQLFDPNMLLQFIVTYLGFLKYLIYCLPIFIFIAAAIIFNDVNLFKHDLAKVSDEFNLVAHLIYTLFTLNLCTIILKGCIAKAHGLDIQKLRIIFVFGLIPRFSIPISIPESTERAVKLSIYSVPMVVRLYFMSVGMVLWRLTRDSGTSISVWCSALILYSTITLFFVMNPLLGTDGYRFLSTYYNVSRLREKSFTYLKFAFREPPPVIKKYMDSKKIYLIYAILSILFVISFALFISFTLASWLEENYSGFGVFVFLLLAIYVAYFFSTKTRKARMKKIRKKTLEAGSNLEKKRPRSSVSGRFVKLSTVFKLLLLALFIYMLFLPYRYEPGGDVTILPGENLKVYTEIEGLITEIHVEGGSAVNKGDVIAEINNIQIKNEIEKTSLLIQQKLAEIEVLKTTPSPEEIQLAKQAINMAEIVLQYSRKSHEKIEKLYNSSSVSEREYIDSLKQLEIDTQNHQTQLTNLQVLTSKINENLITAEEYHVSILQHDLKILEDDLRKTLLLSPLDGTVTTMDIASMEGKYLKKGDLIAEVESTVDVKVEISIPESEVIFVKTGDQVSFRPNYDPNRRISGKVEYIYPTVSADDLSNKVNVVCLLENDNLYLKTGMSGHAKIEGREMTVLEAFSRSLMKFILIDLWSWIP